MLELKNIYKTYSSKNGVTHRALENVSIKFNEKGLVFLLGKSGSGKSTLLNLIGGIDNFDRGDIIFNNRSFLDFKESDFDYYRNTCVGFVFQDFNLLDNLTVYENVALALSLQSKKDHNKVLEMLDSMGVLNLKNRKMDELSGGQRQRVSIARALIKDPKIILADEPTGSLDSETSDAIIKILKDLSKDRLVIIVTHNRELAYNFGDRIIEIRDGFILKDLMRKDLIVNNELKPTLVSSNLIIVPKNQKVSEENINDLNRTILEKRQDYYLLVDDDKYRAMSLYPNVKEVIDDESHEEAFEPFNYVSEEKEVIEEPIKSHLPFNKAISFSMSNLKKKKLRLFFTILLAILSVILTGTAINFTQYSFNRAVATSISKDNGSYVEVSSSFALKSENYALQSNDISYLNSLNRQIAYEYNQPFTYNIVGGGNELNQNITKNVLFNKSFAGFLVCDDISDYGYNGQDFKVIYEKENITEEDYQNGIYLSSVVANVIVRYIKDYGTLAYQNRFHITQDSTIDVLIGQKLPVTSSYAHGITTFNFEVLGIFDVDEDQSLYQRYHSLELNQGGIEISSEYQELSKSILTRMVVKPNFMEAFKKSYPFFTIPSSLKTLNNNDISVNYIYSIEHFSNDLASYQESEDISFYFTDPKYSASNFLEAVSNLKPNQVFVGRYLFSRLINKGRVFPVDVDEYRLEANNYNNTRRTFNIVNSRGSNGEIYQSVENMEVVGVIDRKTKNTNSFVANTDTCIYVANAVFDGLSNNYYKPSKALVKALDNENFEQLITNLYNNGFTIENEFVSYFVSFASTIEKYSTLINIVAIIWFIVVAILLYSFISSSIKDSSKQIGILKSLGATIKDVYKIYAVEALLIGLFATVFGVLGYYAIGISINNIITYYFYTFYFPIFNFKAFDAIVMILSTFVILIVSLTIPMSRIKGIKPIDVMNVIN